jgi:hypothetical protein
MKIERRTLEEQVGVSVNSSSLRMESREPGAETSLQRVAALGASVLHVQHGADRGGPRGAGQPVVYALAQRGHEAKPIDQVSGELAGVLYHLRFGGQHELVGQAIALFAAYIGMRERFGPGGFLAGLTDHARAELLRRFAERVLHEWLSDRCVACGGSGKLERTESGSWIKPRGLMKRNAVMRVCSTCQGSRRAVPSHTARRKALGIEHQQYEVQNWAKHFNAAFTWLWVWGRLRRPLTVQLERSRKRE